MDFAATRLALTHLLMVSLVGAVQVVGSVLTVASLVLRLHLARQRGSHRVDRVGAVALLRIKRLSLLNGA